MADIIRIQTEGVPNTMYTRYEDMGDGSHALVVSVDGSDVGLVDGTETGLVAGTVVGIVDAAGDRANVDSIVGALQAITVLHHETHEGNTFFVSFKTADGAPLADNATLIFVLTTGAKACHAITDAASGGNADKEICEGATITGGTATTVYNRDRTSALATTVTVVRDPTINAAGTCIDFQLIAGGTGGNASGGSAGPRNEWILAPSTLYMYRLTNRAGNAQPASLSVEWYEE